MESLWIETNCRQLFKNGLDEPKRRISNDEKTVRCLFYAAKHGGKFWNVIRKALEQVVSDYEIPKIGADYLNDFIEREDSAIADYLVPFMVNNNCPSEMITIIRKSLIYDLLVQIGRVPSTSSNQNICLEPLIVAMCTNASEQLNHSAKMSSLSDSRDDMVTYSAHLQDRDNVEAMLIKHEKTREVMLDQLKTPISKQNFSNETPIIRRPNELESPQDKVNFIDRTPIITRLGGSTENLPLHENHEGTPIIRRLTELNSESSNSDEDIADKSEDGSTNLITEDHGQDDITNILSKVNIAADTSDDSKSANLSNFNFSTMEFETEKSPEKSMVSIEDSPTAYKEAQLEIIEFSSDEEKTQEFEWESIRLNKRAIFTDSTPLRCSVFSPIQQEVAVGSNSKLLRLFDYEKLSDSGESNNISQLQPILVKSDVHDASIYCVDYSDNGNLLATGSNDKVIKIMRSEYSPESGSTVALKVCSEMTSHTSTIRKVKFLPETSILASGGGADGRVYLTDCDKDELLFYLDHLSKSHGQIGGKSNVITDIAVSDNSVLYSAFNSSIFGWDIRANNQVSSSQIMVGTNIQSVACSVDQTSHFIATGGENGVVGFWDTRNTATPIYCYDKHKKPVRSVSMAGDWLVSCSMDGILGIHNLSIGRPVVELSQKEKLINVQIAANQKNIVTTSSDGYFSLYNLQF